MSSIHWKCQYFSFHSSFSLAFTCMKNIMAVHILLNLICTACLYMKRESWGYCVSVVDFFGEAAVCHGDTVADVPGGSGTNLRLGGPHLAVMFQAPWEVLPWNWDHVCSIVVRIKQSSGRYYVLLFSPVQLRLSQLAPELVTYLQRQRQRAKLNAELLFLPDV